MKDVTSHLTTSREPGFEKVEAELRRGESGLPFLANTATEHDGSRRQACCDEEEDVVWKVGQFHVRHAIRRRVFHSASLTPLSWSEDRCTSVCLRCSQSRTFCGMYEDKRSG